MNSNEENAKQVFTSRGEIVKLIEKVRASVSQDKQAKKFSASILARVEAAAEQSDDFVSVKSVVQQCIQDVAKWQAALQDIATQIDELEANQALREQFSESWWQRKQILLYEAFKNGPHDGLNQWLHVYADALIAWELAICEKLVNEPFPFPPQASDVPTLFQNGTQAIRDENYQQALEMLTYLTKATSSSKQNLLENTQQAIVLVLMGRILLNKVPRSKTALKHFEHARELEPRDGRPYAALGEYYRRIKEYEKAQEFYQQATQISPKQPEGYIGSGLLFEDRNLWDEADDCYDVAIEAVREEKNSIVALNKLLAPVSGRLYLEFARILKKKGDLELALQAVELAISIGINDDGAYPERIGYRLKGDILKKLYRLDEAAKAYYEAGSRFNSRNEFQISADLLTKAQELNPNHVYTYWELSFALRMSSYLPTFPYQDETMLKKSLTIWEQGYEIETPNSDDSWVYVERAVICDDLADLPGADFWDLHWEAISYLERANILQAYVYSWAYLARYYRYLEQGSSALQAVRKALASDPENIIALDEQVYILADREDYDAALKVIDKRKRLEPNVVIDAMKAFVLMSKNGYQEAKELLQGTLKTEPDSIWYHSLLATCCMMLDEPLCARDEYQWIWDHYQQSDTNNRFTFAWAAFNLGRLDVAIEIFSKLGEDRIGAGSAYWDLGLCYLTQGAVAHGEAYMNKGIGMIKTVVILNELLREDLYIIEKLSASWPHGDRVGIILNQFKEKINARIIQLKRRRTMVEDLKVVIKENRLEEDTFNWAWLGAHASLARFYSEKGQWSEAVKTYHLLQSQSERFPEAHYGLAKAFDGLQAEGDTRIKEGLLSEALEQFRQILILELLPNDKTRQAQLYSRLGYVYFALTNMDNARNYFAKAIQLFHETNTSSPGDALGEVCLSLLRNASDYQALESGWKIMANEPGIDEALRSDLTAASTLFSKVWW